MSAVASTCIDDVGGSFQSSVPNIAICDYGEMENLVSLYWAVHLSIMYKVFCKFFKNVCKNGQERMKKLLSLVCLEELIITPIQLKIYIF